MYKALQETDRLSDKTKELYDKFIKYATNSTSFINNIEFDVLEMQRFHFLSDTFVGKFGKAFAKCFNADYGIVIMSLLIFASTFLCHVKFRTSAKFTTNCNIYALIIGPPGSRKSPVAKVLSEFVMEVIDAFGKRGHEMEHFWITGFKHVIQSSVCSLARNCQLTQQCSGLQTQYADELAQASQTFQFNKKADESEGIAFLTSGYDCKAISREFCDQKYHCYIERPYISLAILSQPDLSQDFLIGGKAKMGFAARCLISFANIISDEFGSVRYNDASQISEWETCNIETILVAMFKSLATLLFCNLRSNNSKVILKYTDECSLILVAWEWCIQRLRYTYTKGKERNDAQYDPDFGNSLSKSLNQIDKVVASLFFINKYVQKPMNDTFNIDEEYYHKNVINGSYADCIYYIDNATLVYGAMELIIDCKLNELYIKRKAMPFIDFDVKTFLLGPKTFSCDGEKIERFGAREATVDSFEEDVDLDDHDDELKSPELDTVNVEKSFQKKLAKHKNSEKNIISIFITIPGSHINVSNIKTCIRAEGIKNQFPPTFKERVQLSVELINMKDKGIKGYLDNIGAALNHVDFGVFLKDTKQKGAKNIFIKPNIIKELQIYLTNIKAYYEENATNVVLDDQITYPLTKEILEILYSVGVAPSHYIEQYQKQNIYKPGKNNNAAYLSYNQMQNLYAKKFDYNEIIKNGHPSINKAFNKDSHETIREYHGHCWRNSKGNDDIHFRIYAMEYYYNVRNDENEDKEASHHLYYYSPIQSRYFDAQKSLSFASLPGEIKKFFDSPEGRKVQYYYLKKPESIKAQICKEHGPIEMALMQWAHEYEPVKDTINKNRLYQTGQQPRDWNIAGASKTKTPKHSK